LPSLCVENHKTVNWEFHYVRAEKLNFRAGKATPPSGCFGVLENIGKKKRVGYHPDPRYPRPLNHHDERSYDDVTKS
jgi:hypothetical protein